MRREKRINKTRALRCAIPVSDARKEQLGKKRLADTSTFQVNIWPRAKLGRDGRTAAPLLATKHRASLVVVCSERKRRGDACTARLSERALFRKRLG